MLSLSLKSGGALGLDAGLANDTSRAASRGGSCAAAAASSDDIGDLPAAAGSEGGEAFPGELLHLRGFRVIVVRLQSRVHASVHLVLPDEARRGGPVEAAHRPRVEDGHLLATLRRRPHPLDVLRDVHHAVEVVVLRRETTRVEQPPAIKAPRVRARKVGGNVVVL